MATIMHSLRLAARRTNCRPVIYQSCTRQINKQQPFSVTPLQRKQPGKDGKSVESAKTSDAVGAVDPKSPSTKEPLDMDKRLREDLDIRLKEQLDNFVYGGALGDDSMFTKEQDANKEVGRRVHKETFMNMGEEESFSDEEIDEDDEDGISTLGHLELEQHREMRHYARLAAWDMPLLAKMAKPFQPPTTNEPLRFRYTTYMGEQHPAEKKIVCEFCTADMPNLTELQRDKLKKLAGVRYNPETDIIRMSSEMYETQAQNKRYLGELIQRLLVEARDPTDTFEDVPLDTRHHVFKTKPKFPKEWRMTPERRAEIEAHRQAMIDTDLKKELGGEIVDGVSSIQKVLAAKVVTKTAVPEAVLAGKGKVQRATVRR